jgi:hypothetical protein
MAAGPGKTTLRQLVGSDGTTAAEVDGATNALKVLSVGGGSGGTSSNFGATFPTVGTAAGFIGSTGNMAGANLDASGNLKVSGTIVEGESPLNVTGTATSAAVILTQASTAGYFSCFFQISGIGTSTVVAEINNNGTWVVTDVVNTGAVNPVAQTSVTVNGIYAAVTGGIGFRLRVSVYDGSATVAANAEFRTFPINIPAPATVTSKTTPSGTGSPATVASSASSVTVLAANANRLGATVYNDSTQVLYLLLQTGGTATTSTYTIQMASQSYYEVPFAYNGALIGIWASANGNARVTELT